MSSRLKHCINRLILSNEHCCNPPIYSQPIAASVANPQQGKYLYDQRAVTKIVDVLKKAESASPAVKERKCFFCEGLYHYRRHCPASNVEFDECGKMRLFAKVCLSKCTCPKGPNTSAALLSEH